MNHCDFPLVFWYYCVEWRVRIHNVSAKDSFNLDGKNPHMVTTGETADISNYVDLDFISGYIIGMINITFLNKRRELVEP